ncbi:MAG: ankyrin repeat domain-containing protein [Phycisphaerae bacterium]|nr:ankyrin repeat domain-containing protein [Phycisphaerae bacterium]NUQ44817.1 ankyrin repeat domain-containing protein [Phycisphaerae bacterium]
MDVALLHKSHVIGAYVIEQPLLNRLEGTMNTTADSMKKAVSNAAEKGNASELQRLITDGADINHRSGMTGATALHDAAALNKPGMAHLLLTHGADIAAADDRGKTALHDASWYDHTDVAKMLLDKGADVDAVDRNGRTALHDAAEAGSEEAIQLLLNRGANVHAIDDYGRTAEQLARLRGNLEMAEILRDDANRRPRRHER